MSLRERPGASGTTHPPASAASPAPQPPPGRNGDLPPSLSWDLLFPALTSAQQQMLLDLSSRQGFVYAHQLPDATAVAERGRALISEFLQGPTRDRIVPAQIEAIVAIDSQLDAWQLDAVAKAIYTPDLCLIQGGAGTGKSRVIAEIIRQAAGRGRRVLLLAPHAAALDVVLAGLAHDSSLLVLRCLARDERADHLSPSSTAYTLAAYRQRLTEKTAVEVRRSIDDRTLRIGRARAELPALERLCELSRRRHGLESSLSEPCPMPTEGDDFSRELAAVQSEHDSNLFRHDETIRSATAELQAIQKQIADLDSQLTATEHAAADRGWISKLFDFSASRHAAEAREGRAELDKLRASEGQIKLRAERSALERQQFVAGWEAERKRRIDEETSRRSAIHEMRRSEMKEELARLKPEIDRAWVELGPGGGLSSPSDFVAIAEACQSKRGSIEQDEREAEFALRWNKYLNENAGQLSSQLLPRVNVVVAPLGALSSDDALADLTRSALFDVLILDETDRVSEAELHSAMRCARHWVLVGESLVESGAASGKHDERKNGDESSRNGRRSGHAGKNSPSRSCPWPRLWQQLHAESWCIKAGRLSAHLLPLTDAHQSELESEPVADSPDVELRIWTPANGSPSLAEVRFPAATPVPEALAFLHRELGEIPAGAGPLCWNEQNGRVLCQLMPATSSPDAAPIPATEPVELEPGLRARLAICGDAWRLAAIEFDVAAGWDKERAETWVRQSLHIADFGRTARLPIARRAEAGVEGFLANLGLLNAKSASASAPAIPAVEFIPVPALANEPQARRRGDVGLSSQQRRLPPLRGGAGFEIDLADPRQRERLPAELQSRLPDRGFVNPSEAQAIVRLLENLIDDLPADPAARPAAIAVLPLYEAQSEFVRVLAAQSPILSAPPLPIYIESPGRFRQREADVVLVGLTRSHSHRAVSYGDESTAVPQALTRARRRLVLIGDPGTLARRAQWDGPLDHLDEMASRREKEWVAALVRQLQGLGVSTVHLREGPP